jgi:hypothetical protein
MKYIYISVLLIVSQLYLTGCGGGSSSKQEVIKENGSVKQETIDPILENEQESLIKEDNSTVKEDENLDEKRQEEILGL